MGALSDIISKLGDIPTNAVLRERVAFAADQANALEKKVENLERETPRLEKRIAALRLSLPPKHEKSSFVEHRGALFKRKPEGGLSSGGILPSLP
jgi:hypothetical protein